ncbi:MAG TPA: DUF445 domain-containing protein, partial [Burkholderiaceae bacterium]|nr:DUF445 domain-containing protein [Burkholderiaceae bacterium]
MTLARMKQLALALLLAMLALIALCVALQASHPGLAWVRVFAEAAAVGALADWFAVTALFAHPLGLPIPHTAIIPRNKDEIGVALGEFVEHNFLTPDNVLRKLAQQELARAATQWLADAGNRARVAQRACAALAAVLERLDDEDVKRFLDRTLTPRLMRINVARVAGELLDVLASGNRHHALLDQGLRALDTWLDENRALVRDKVGEGARLTPRFVDAYIANRFIDGVQALLHEVATDPEHGLRRRFDAAARELIQELKTSPEYRQRGAALLRVLIEHLRQDGYYAWLGREIKTRLRADLASASSVVQR